MPVERLPFHGPFGRRSDRQRAPLATRPDEDRKRARRPVYTARRAVRVMGMPEAAESRRLWVTHPSSSVGDGPNEALFKGKQVAAIAIPGPDRLG